MKKTIILLLSITIIVSCRVSDETIGESLANQSENDFITALENTTMSMNKSGETVIMDYSIGAVAPPQNGGCSSETRDSNGNPGINNEGFGPNPINFWGHNIRGFGRPTTTIHYSGIRFYVSNESKTIVSRGVTRITDNPKSQAISIEQVFEPNFTYEIKLKIHLTDRIYYDKTGSFDIEKSEGKPVVKVQLKETPEIAGENPCQFWSHVDTSKLGVTNYLKQHKFDNYASDNIYTFNFSPVEKTNALVIYFFPAMSEQRNTTFVPRNVYGISLTNIKITQKPYDSQYFDEDEFRSSGNDDIGGGPREPGRGRTP